MPRQSAKIAPLHCTREFRSKNIFQNPQFGATAKYIPCEKQDAQKVGCRRLTVISTYGVSAMYLGLVTDGWLRLNRFSDQSVMWPVDLAYF